MFIRLVTLVLMIANVAIAQDDLRIQQIFEHYAVEGTLVLSELSRGQHYVYNEQRAHVRYTPASTFKIPHTLIALEEGVIGGAGDHIPWDGVTRFHPPWNKDQTARSAFQVSCVWCYQQFTQHIAPEKYLNYLAQFSYGNQKIGPDITRFWLDGDLAISAYEQIEFLKRLYRGTLGVQADTHQVMKDIMVLDDTKNATMYPKTGWSGSLGWYVGYLESPQGVWFFAMNGEISQPQLPLRQQIVLDVLKMMKLWDGEG